MMKHFTIEELIHSERARAQGIDNTPTPESLENIKALMAGLEEVRALLGKPMLITSGYRCPELNRAVGGSKNSAHVQGFAADFVSPLFGSPRKIAEKIAASGIKFDQCIFEDMIGQWVHISFAPEMRQQVLTINKQGTFNGVVKA
jgi:zinc D-Ala-D-Ala carboxypeptidase